MAADLLQRIGSIGGRLDSDAALSRTSRTASRIEASSSTTSTGRRRHRPPPRRRQRASLTWNVVPSPTRLVTAMDPRAPPRSGGRCEPQAKAAVASVVGVAAAVEALEQERQVLVGDADPRSVTVRWPARPPARSAARPGRRHRSTSPRSTRFWMSCRSRAASNKPASGLCAGELDARRAARACLQRLACDLHQVARSHARLPPGLRADDIQVVVDQRLQPLRLRAQRARPLRVAAVAIERLLEQLRVDEDGGQRGPDVMRHHGQEVVLQSGHLRHGAHLRRLAQQLLAAQHQRGLLGQHLHHRHRVIGEDRRPHRVHGEYAQPPIAAGDRRRHDGPDARAPVFVRALGSVALGPAGDHGALLGERPTADRLAGHHRLERPSGWRNCSTPAASSQRPTADPCAPGGLQRRGRDLGPMSCGSARRTISGARASAERMAGSCQPRCRMAGGAKPTK